MAVKPRSRTVQLVSNSAPARAECLERRTLLAFPVSVGSTAFDSAYAVAAMPDGGVVMAGLFKGSMDFDPTSGRRVLIARGEETDVYVARYSASGALAWAHAFGSEEGEFDDGGRIPTAIDPRRASGYDLGVGLQPANLGEYVSAMTTDDNGNIYLTGAFRGQVDFDPGPGRATLSSINGEDFVDTYLMRLNPNGTLAFVRQIGGQFTDVAEAIALDDAGNIYLTGYFTREADFDPGAGRLILSTEDESRHNLFVARYDNNGSVTWARGFQNNEIRRVRRSTGYGLAVSGDGSVFVAGSFSGETDFDPSPQRRAILNSFGETDAFAMRLTGSSGDLTWVKTWGGEQFDAAVSLALSPQGNSVYIGTVFEDRIDVDPGKAVIPVTATPEDPGDEPERGDLLVTRLDAAAGVLRWARKLGTDGWETLGAVRTDSVGNVYVTGGFYGSMDFDPGRGRTVLSSTPGADDDFDDPEDGDREDSYDAFLWGLDANGAFRFATRLGAAGDDYGIALAINAQNQLFVAGQFRGTVRFANSSAKLRPVGKEDSFVVRYDSLGALLA